MSSISFKLGYRYLRSTKGGIFSFTTILAILGLTIGVSSLIIVTSVMNGFQKELENRILGVIPHSIILSNNQVYIHLTTCFISFFWKLSYKVFFSAYNFNKISLLSTSYESSLFLCCV